MAKPDKELTLTGYNCPIPVIKLSATIAQLHAGQILSITGDDPMLESSIRDYCEANKHEVLSVEKHNKHAMTILVRK